MFGSDINTDRLEDLSYKYKISHSRLYDVAQAEKWRLIKEGMKKEGFFYMFNHGPLPVMDAVERYCKIEQVRKNNAETTGKNVASNYRKN